MTTISTTLNQILRKNPVTAPYYLGCFPSDLIPEIKRFPASMVVNLDVSSEPGSHWVALFAPTKDVIYYFDSYGQTPNDFLKETLSKFQNVKKNGVPYQSILSEVCGYYTMFFIFLCSLGYSFEYIKNLLKAQSDTDGFVMNFVNKNIVM